MYHPLGIKRGVFGLLFSFISIVDPKGLSTELEYLEDLGYIEGKNDDGNRKNKEGS